VEQPAIEPAKPPAPPHTDDARSRRIFRSDFLREYRRRADTGDVLKLSPRWVQPCYWLVIALAVAGLSYGDFGRVHEYDCGPDVVRFTDRADLTALSEGTVADVLIRPGQPVLPGQTLVRFYSGEESAELERVEREFQLQLVNLLRDPSDPDARQSMARLRAERERMRSHLEERAVRAPIAGTASDIRIRPGQHLALGDPVITVVGTSPQLNVVVVLPGHYRPLLKPGLPLRLQLTGYPYVHQDLAVTAIGDEIVGPGAIRRYLGEDIGDAVPLSGPAVLVYVSLPRRGFRWEGRERPYYDGMLGRAQVSVRNQSVLVALIPGLRALLERPNG